MPAELDAMPLEELRRRRDEVRDEEEQLSYRRRLLHAQLDILEAAAEAEDPESFAATLAAVLADGPSGDTPVRSVDVEEEHDGVDMEPLPADLLALSPSERTALRERLQTDERATSDRRRELLADLDALQDELVRRYRRDGVDARALLGEDG